MNLFTCAENNHPNMHRKRRRRDVIKGIGAAGVVALAGCTGDDDGSGGDGSGDDGSGDNGSDDEA